MSKHRIVVFHPSTDRYWFSAFDKVDIDELSGFIKSVAEGASYLKFETESGNIIVFPKEFIQQCVFTIEKSQADV